MLKKSRIRVRRKNKLFRWSRMLTPSIIVLSLASLGGAGYYLLKPKNQAQSTFVSNSHLSYGEWFQKWVPGNKSNEFDHPWFGLNVPTESIIAELEDITKSELTPKFGDSLELKLQNAVSFKEIEGWQLSEKRFQEYQNLANKAIDGFFVDLNLQLPQIKITRVTPNTYIYESSPNLVNLFLVWDHKKVTQATFRLQGENLEAVHRLEEHKEALSEVTSDLYFTIRDDQVVLTENKNHPAIITLGYGPIHSYSALLSETLHTILKPYTAEFMRADIDTEWKARGRPLDRDELGLLVVPDSILQSAYHKWLNREESIHLLVHRRLIKVASSAGLDPKDIEEYLRIQLGKPSYFQVERLNRLFGDYTSAQLIRMYRQNPGKLFDNK